MRRLALRLPYFGFADGTLESWLTSKDTAKYALAEKVFQQMGEEKTLTFLLTTIKAEERRRRLRGWRNFALIEGGFVAAQCAIDSLAGPGHHHFSIMGGAGGCSVVAINGGLPSRLHRHCLERLAMIDDRRAFPALVAALVTSYRIAGNTVARRLTQMLPELDAEDFARLPEAHQKRFLGFINPQFARNTIDEPTRRELAHALLLTVTRMGNSDALPRRKNWRARHRRRKKTRSFKEPRRIVFLCWKKPMLTRRRPNKEWSRSDETFCRFASLLRLSRRLARIVA